MSFLKVAPRKITPLHIIAGGFLALVLAFGATILIAPQTHAAWGSGGNPGGGGGVGHYTWHGFGWKRFSKTGGGPNAGFRDGTSWSSIQAACAPYSGSTVWVHVIRNSSGSEKGYNYNGASYNRNRPAAGGDPWMYNGAGNYAPQGAAYQNHVINIVAGVRAAFNVEHSAYDSHWGVNVAWFCDGPLRKNWSIRGESYIQKGPADITKVVQGTINAAPGERLNWYHDLRNRGPDSMDRRITYQIDKTGFSNGWNGIVAPSSTGIGGVNALFVRIYATLGSAYTLYDVTQNDVGNTLCQRISWVPGSSSSGSRHASGYACAHVPYDYSLVPAITNITDDTPVETSSGNFPVVGSVTNPTTSITKSHPNINWRITQVRFSSEAAVTNRSGGISASDPCAFFSGNTGCTTAGSGTHAPGYARGATVSHNGTGNVGNDDVGTYLCFAMSVRRHSSNATNGTQWRHSELRCHVVSKKPKVHIIGGDLLVGRGSATNSARVAHIHTSTTRDGATNRVYGSWGEYAIVPSGVIFGMASASGYVNGATTTGVNLLSFANNSNTATPTCPVGSVGCYNHGSTAPNVAARFPTTGSSVQSLPGTNIDITGSNLSGIYTTNAASISLRSSGEIPAGRSIIINAPNTTVTIVGNIRYTSAPLSGVQDIPQVVIIARNILVAHNATNPVTQIDSWLVAVGAGAHGRINTCVIGGNEATLPTSETCNHQLVVNGPVLANHLILRRTYGADPSSGIGAAAEVFNLRADAYIWATSYAPGTGRLPAATVNELPPRF